MTALKTAIVALGLVLTSAFANGQEIQLKMEGQLPKKYRLEGESSLIDLLHRWVQISRYDLTYTGVHDLPVVPEIKVINEAVLHDAIGQVMGVYAKYNLGVFFSIRIDNKSKHVYLTSGKTAEAISPNRPDEKPPMKFAVGDADKSLMQVLVRWATLSGFQTQINNQPVHLDKFPLHTVKYSDYSLIDSAKKFGTNAPLKEAARELLLLYTGLPLAPFKIDVDESTNQMHIMGLTQ